MYRRIILIIASVLLLCTITVNAFASSATLDLSEKGSLTIYMDMDGKKLDGGYLSLYRVGDITKTEDGYNIQLVEPLQCTDAELTDPEDPMAAAELLDAAKSVLEERIKAPIADGKAVFVDLPVGLYVVWQDASEVTEGYQPIQPFLITLPHEEDGMYALDVKADPKVSIESVPEETPDDSSDTPQPPTDEKLPQTGQLKWPVPVMAVMGILLFIIGGILYISGKRTGNEK